MNASRLLLMIAVAWIQCGCKPAGSGVDSADKGTSAGASAESNVNLEATSRPAFMDEKHTVPSQLEWLREVTAKSPGTIRFRITSQGPFSVTVVTDRALKAIQSGSEAPLGKEDLLLVMDSTEPTADGTVSLPAGSSYFIIKNSTAGEVEFRLQCFAAN